MTRKTKGWPPERRKRQAALMRKTKPWKHATGPKTTAGKATSKNNAYKHGFDSAAMRDLRSALYQQRIFLNALEKTLGIRGRL